MLNRLFKLRRTENNIWFCIKYNSKYIYPSLNETKSYCLDFMPHSWWNNNKDAVIVKLKLTEVE